MRAAIPFLENMFLLPTATNSLTPDQLHKSCFTTSISSCSVLSWTHQQSLKNLTKKMRTACSFRWKSAHQGMDALCLGNVFASFRIWMWKLLLIHLPLSFFCAILASLSFVWSNVLCCGANKKVVKIQLVWSLEIIYTKMYQLHLPYLLPVSPSCKAWNISFILAQHCSMLVIASSLKSNNGNELALTTTPHKKLIKDHTLWIWTWFLAVILQLRDETPKHIGALRVTDGSLSPPPSPSVYPSHVNSFQHSQLTFCIVLHIYNIGTTCQGYNPALIILNITLIQFLEETLKLSIHSL